jgi:hypothetical protein
MTAKFAHGDGAVTIQITDFCWPAPTKGREHGGGCQTRVTFLA